jgi:hypothetical protein
MKLMHDEHESLHLEQLLLSDLLSALVQGVGVRAVEPVEMQIMKVKAKATEITATVIRNHRGAHDGFFGDVEDAPPPVSTLYEQSGRRQGSVSNQAVLVNSLPQHTSKVVFSMF